MLLVLDGSINRERTWEICIMKKDKVSLRLITSQKAMLQKELERLKAIKTSCINCKFIKLSFQIECLKSGKILESTLGSCDEFEEDIGTGNSRGKEGFKN